MSFVMAVGKPSPYTAVPVPESGSPFTNPEMFDLATTDNVKSSLVTDPHRPKDFLDPTEIKSFLEAAKDGGNGVRDHLLFLMMNGMGSGVARLSICGSRSELRPSYTVGQAIEGIECWYAPNRRR
jgi:hypothetical protein